jgi:queuine/archaeosine tRNA-ribosyltransferase
MKKIYVIPTIRIQEIDTQDGILETPMSIPVYTNEDELIEDSSEILVNTHSIWDE